MKKIFNTILVAALFLAAASCEKNEVMPQAAQGDGFALVGTSSLKTKTSFGTPDESSIPFLWSAGDFITVNGVSSEAITEGGETAEFVFTSGSIAPGDAVYYGSIAFEGSTCNVWTAPWQNGSPADMCYDFGYAVVGDDNTFVLEHYSSYLWLNTYSSDVIPKVSKIVITAEKDFVGSAPFDASAKNFGEIKAIEDQDPLLASTKTMEIEFQDDNQELAPKALLAEPSDEQMWAVAVSFPVTTGALRVDYHFEDGKLATFNYDSKTLAAGTTYRISQEIKTSDLYELKVLTFEDADYKGNASNSDTYWSDLIPDTEYGNGHGQNSWCDENNTNLAFTPSTTALFPGQGGHAISKYYGNSLENITYMNDLQAYNVVGGANGSTNFASHFGYLDNSGYGMMNELIYYHFSDNTARVIDHMYVTNTTYVYSLLTYGDGWQVPNGASESSTFKIVAYGYNGDEPTGTTEFYLWKAGKIGVDEWTKWDLSSLGKVTRVEFNLIGSEDLYGSFGLGVAGYFAYDNVAVRFE